MKNMGKNKSVEFIILFSVYIALLCVVVHPKRFTIMWGGSLLNHHQCIASTWMKNIFFVMNKVI